MKFSVTYEQPKKKGFAKQTAVFYKIEDAHFWQEYIKNQGCKNIQVLANFN
jgi:hypothetical protein